MDVRAYYRKVRDAEASLTDAEHFVMVSLGTQDGGRPGVMTEAPRTIAARLIAEGRSRVATEEEAIAFHERNRVAREQYEREQDAKRVQVVVIPSTEPAKKVRS